MNRLRIGVIGVGHLGRHHARIVSGLEDATLAGVVDTRIEQAEAVAGPLGVPALTNYKDLLPLVDAVSVVVPTTYHAEVAGFFLEHGIHCLIEKPLAPSVAEADELVRLAERGGVVLQVGHIERFNPAFQTLKASGIRPNYVHAERLGVYTFRSTDISVVLDLMVHDIDLVLNLVAAPVSRVSALGMPLFGGLEDVAQARVEFEDGTVVDFSTSRVSYQPSRRLRAWSREAYASVDFASRQTTLLRPSEALRQGSPDWTGIDRSQPNLVRDHLFGHLLEVEHSAPPAIDALTLELEDFTRAIRSGDRPRVDGVDGLKAVALAERIQSAIRSGTPSPASPSHAPSRVPAPKLWRRRPRGASTRRDQHSS
jgi:predicted dehydrogenase